MSIRGLLAAVLLLLLATLAAAQTLEPSSYTLTAGGAEKFVRATQLMIANGGSGPDVQGDALDLERMKAGLEQDDAARAALADAGISSTDYVLFLSAAMQSLMIGQMEQAGVRGVLPPGVTARPPQQNIDFMNRNADLFARAITPGAPAASVAEAPASGEDLPVPEEAGRVLPSELLGRLPPLAAIEAGADCTLAELQTVIDEETQSARALEAAYYGNPGDAGLARTPAEGRVLERAGDTELLLCGQLTNFGGLGAGAIRDADAAKARELDAISQQEQAAWNACPGIPGGKEPACERAVEAEAAAKRDAAERRFLAAASPSFAGMIRDMQACNAKREGVVIEAKRAGVRGANVKEVLRPLVAAWDLVPLAISQWQAVCESAQQNLR